MTSSSRKLVAPHFFRIIFEDELREGKLGLPKMFVRKYGRLLSNSAFLRTPSGSVWKVHLTKRNDQILLGKGWAEFALFYSLKPGHLLIFGYEEHSSFNVLIFDMSATEIEYPFRTSNGDEINHDVECQSQEDESDVSVEILDEVWASSKAKRKLPTSNSRSTHEKKKLTLYNRGSHYESQGWTSDALNLKKSKISTEGRGGTDTVLRSCKHASSRKSRRLTSDEKAEVLSKANGFKSENPFFVVALQRSHVVGSKPHMCVPSIFAKTYFPENGRGKVNLGISDGRVWSVEYKKYESNRMELWQGWRKFSQDNELQVGDACVFELLKGPAKSMKVVVFKS